VASPIPTVTSGAFPHAIAAGIERYFRVSLFLLIATGFATLISTGKLDPLSVLVVSIALVVRAYLLLKQRELKVPERWANYFTMIYVLVFVIDLFMISGNYVTASIHLVLFSLIVKMFSVQRERDNIYLAVLAFMAVLAASVLTVDTAFLGAFVIFMMLAVNTFVSMEIRRSLRNATYCGLAPSQTAADRRFGIILSSTGLAIVCGIVIVSAALFFVLPRFSAGYLSGYASRNELMTGFSDRVNLGAIGRIQQTDSIVMHVKMDARPPDDLKFRGVALNNFDGRTWKDEATAIGEMPVGMPSNSGRFSLRKLQIQRRNLPSAPQSPGEFHFLRYHIVMEPIGTDIVFLAPVAVELGGPFRAISVDNGGAVTNIDRGRMTESYDAVSQLMEPSADKLRAASAEQYPPEFAAMYLQLADLDPRVRELAGQITANATSNYDKALAIEDYLQNHFGYTLQLPNTPPADPVADFLFVRKAGHCEYFASAMAVMLRSQGIPSRVVNGFRNGEYNDLTGSYIVRARNAHTWVEAYIPNYGWTSFDPTPADPLPAVTSLNRIRLYLDAAQEFWREWIINYDFSHQRELTTTTVSMAQRSVFDVRRWLRKQYMSALKLTRRADHAVSNDPRKWVAFGFVVAAIVFLLWNSRRLLRALRRRAVARTPSKAPQLAATIWYSRMLKSVEKRGFAKPENQTPLEFVNTISDATLRESVARFTARYERARFGESSQDAEQLPLLFGEIAGKK
jgi:transglutaminase-like putative cysteine protease